MSRQRAQRRTQRQQQQRSVAEARAAREQQRRQARRQARPAAARRRTGWAGLRRSRGQRLAIAAVAVLGTALIWLLVDWPLAIGLTALLLLALPAFVVLTMGRRY